jgi:hypothetical protein
VDANFLQWALDLALAILGTIGFFAIRALVSKVEEHSTKIEDLRVIVAGEYVKWSALNEVLSKVLTPIAAHLTRIEDKLDGKADK